MDPDENLRQLLDALRAREWERVDELSATMIGWLNKNGFPPTTIGDSKLGKKWHRSIALFVCRSAQSYGDRHRTRKRTP